VQFHPEVAHTQQGQEMLQRFLYDIAGIEPTWTPTNIIDDQVAAIQAQVGDKQVICGLSGGVDSAVAAALVHKAIGDQLTCVFVDHGLLRAGEAEQVEKDYVAATGIRLKVVDASERFLGALQDVEDPERNARSSAGSSSGCSSRPPARWTPNATSSSWSRAPSTRTWSSPVAAPAPRTSRATTTSAVFRRT
jgi:hypothetical protein